jgi:predicted Zn finger-like uncharacterized protein
MLIVCPNCATSYDLTAAALGEGRSVRCTRCRTVWFATAQEPFLEMAEAPEAASAAQAESGSEAAPAGQGEFQDEMAEASGTAAESAEAGFETAPVAEAGADMPPLVEGVENAPPLVPGPEDGAQFAAGEGPFPITGGDIDAFERRRATKRAKKKRPAFTWPKFKWPLAPLPTLLLGLGATVIILIGWRADVVRLLPQTASFYSTIGLGVNLRGLVFDNIKTSREIHEGVPVMVVEGEILSVSRKTVEVPRLRFGVRNGLGAEIYHWTAMPGRTTATPGERVTFRSRLASPPTEVHDITVRFYNRRDTMAGVR